MGGLPLQLRRPPPGLIILPLPVVAADAPYSLRVRARFSPDELAAVRDRRLSVVGDRGHHALLPTLLAPAIRRLPARPRAGFSAPGGGGPRAWARGEAAAARGAAAGSAGGDRTPCRYADPAAGAPVGYCLAVGDFPSGTVAGAAASLPLPGQRQLDGGGASFRLAHAAARRASEGDVLRNRPGQRPDLADSFERLSNKTSGEGND